MVSDMNSSEVIVVFGAGGGIGSSLCRIQASRGCRLVLVGRKREPLESLAQSTGNSSFIQADVTSLTDVEAALSFALETNGRLDGVVNCAGSLLLRPAHLTSESQWSQTMAINLTAAFYIVRTAAPLLANNDSGGSIVLVSSSAALHGIANHEAIAAAKAGVVGLARSAAATYARQNVRVNCVAPGLTRTPLTESIISNPAALAASASMHPLGRVGEPNHIASAIAWLLDPSNSWTTGQVLAVDGGLSTLQPRPTAPKTQQPV